MFVVSKFQVLHRLGFFILQGPSQWRHSTLADAHVHDVHRWCFHVPWHVFFFWFSPTEHAGEHECHIFAHVFS